MDIRQLVAEIDSELRTPGTRERAEQEKRYLKSELEHYGVTVPAIRSVANAVRREYTELDHADLIALVSALWATPVHERRMVSVELLDMHADRLLPHDMVLLERLLRESRTWALVDGLAASVVGGLIERHPDSVTVLDRWSADDDFWIRRSAMLALLLPLRRGEGDFDRFRAMRMRCSTRRSSSFVRRSVGSCGKRRRNDRRWSTNGCYREPLGHPE